MSALRNQFTVDTIALDLEKNGGDMVRACQSAGVSVGWLKRWMKEDAKVRQYIEEAAEAGNEVLHAAAITRAVEGISEDVYYQGGIVGTRQVYSDGLLQFLMKGRDQRFNPAQKVEMNGTMHSTYTDLTDEQLEERIAMLEAKLGAALPRTRVIEGEVVEIVRDKLTVEDLL